MARIVNFENENRRKVAMLGRFSVIEYQQDLSVNPLNATSEYFMGKMGVRRRQVVVDIDPSCPVTTQAGAMQWMIGNLNLTSGIKGAGDLFGKMVRGAATGESAVKPEYSGAGRLVLEPTYKYIILQNVANWGSGMVVEDGMFLACDSSVQQRVVRRTNLSSAVAGGEGLFNLALAGQGVVALESNVPFNELVQVELQNETLKIDGHLAVMWSADLEFTVERSSKSLLGSAASGEGLVNVYRGTGRVFMAPVTSSASLYAATTSMSSNG